MREDRRLSALERKVARFRVPAAEVRDAFTPYAADLVGFREHILGYPSARRRSDGTPYQDEILRAVVEVPRVAVVAGHGAGKTRAEATAALGWLLSRPGSKVVVLAPQFERQVRGVLLSEMRKLIRRASVPLPLDVQAGRISVSGYRDEWCIVGVPATEPDRIEGMHAEGGLLLVMDETKGVSQEVFDAMMGALTGGEDSRLLIGSTPGGASGPFYRACSDARGLWQVIRLNSEDSSIVSPQWCADRAAEWGRDSALYQTRVQGCFADAGDGQLFPLSLLEAATGREVDGEGPVVLGVDVARSVAGDLNCIALLRGTRVERFTLWRSPDTMVTVNRVIAEAQIARPSRIAVDVTGVGAGVVDRLKQLRLPVDGVAFGGGSSDASRFRNRRAELFWDLRAALEQGRLALPDDDDLIADLVALRYSFDPAGRIVLEGKDDTRRRLGRSPDRADALALGVAAGLGKARRRVIAPAAGTARLPGLSAADGHSPGSYTTSPTPVLVPRRGG